MIFIAITSIIMTTLGADLRPETMYCSDPGKPSSGWDAPQTWYQSGYFFNGMQSQHSNNREDRVYSIRGCKTSPSGMEDYQTLPYTDWDSSFTRGCGGGSALYRAYSYHDNGREDRRFQFRCAATRDEFILGSCSWIGYYPSNFDADMHADCPDKGVMRTVQSYHNNHHEDRKWRFECCRVYHNPFDYVQMSCTENNFYSNEWDSEHKNQKSDYFLSGMESYHDNGKEDRKFKWKYCKQKSGKTYVGQEDLQKTNYDSTWTRTCEYFNGGNAAMISAYSRHDNGKEDREWTFKCGKLDPESYQLVNCGWTGDLNTMDDKLNFHCPNNGVIRGFKSWHSNGNEDRIWKFDCCNVAEANYDFTNKNGYWVQKAYLGGSGTISRSLTTGVSRTNGQSNTNTFSASLSVAVEAGYTFAIGVSSKVTVTATVAASTASTISESITQMESETISVTCAQGVQYLYQFIFQSDEVRVQTHQYRCTNKPNPACVPGYFNCANNDPNCNSCKSSMPSR